MRVICVDDEQPVLDNFRMKVKGFPEVEELNVFLDGTSALSWTAANHVDTAFLDMEMSGMNGIELARKLKEINHNIRIIFVTAFEQYALEAFGVDALGYILKPYTRDDIQKELQKAVRMKPILKKHIVIQTIPNFAVSVDGHTLHLGRAKPEELLALMVDRAESGITAGEAIACLWPERYADEKTLILYRVTFHRLTEALKKAGIDNIIVSERRKKYIHTDLVECDLYRMLAGDAEVIRNYGGEYLNEYSWAEARNAQLQSIKDSFEKPIVKSGFPL